MHFKKNEKLRSFEANESKPFMIFVKDFWEKHGKDFAHVHLEDFVFIKSETQKYEAHEHYVEILIPEKLMRYTFPKIKYILRVHPSFSLRL